MDNLAKPSAVDSDGFALHTMGWKAFQDLCATVLGAVLGRSIQTFAPSGDGGRDASFSDHATRTTVQVKHTSNPTTALSTSSMASDLAKISKLVAAGLADNYILMTNARLTGHGAAELEKAIRNAGVAAVTIYGRDWLVRTILESSRLRALVPRLYGLGDLSEIFDERSYDQATALFESMGADLAAYVVTGAHRAAINALIDKRLVLILGDPATGKSTIAAMCALAALDAHQARTIRVASPEDIRTHWNPNDPRQLFWIDDAFGSTQLDLARTQSWNATLHYVAAARQRGAMFLLTSRTYIWRDALDHLKIGVLPELGTEQVVVRTHDFSAIERAQILYNHVKFGDQTRHFKTQVKPYLADLSARSQFLPETARRLGKRAFTKHIGRDKHTLESFVDRQAEFLVETLQTLDASSKAAIALVFMHGGKLPSPIPTDETTNAAERLVGSSRIDIARSLESLSGSFVLLRTLDDARYWTFMHPTIADAYASIVATRPELIEVYLRGAKADRISEEVVCAGATISGAQVVIAPALYPLLADRLEEIHPSDWRRFIAFRADDRFMRLIAQRKPRLSSELKPSTFSLSEDSSVVVFSKMLRLGLVSSAERERFALLILEHADAETDATGCDDPDVKAILTPGELNEMIADLQDSLLGQLDSHIRTYEYDRPEDEPPEGFFQPLVEAIEVLAAAAPIEGEGENPYKAALRKIEKKVEEISQNYHYYEPDYEDEHYQSTNERDGTDIFSDIDD